ncbi:hypothetical protein ABXW30_10875, partial [Acinetobacter baumannii]|uniref:hypothetical protein n=1 Tax=Acinetobacter baumannii TaxID=470 RepID=UPI003492AC1D
MTEQTNKKLMLDESPDMPLQFKWRKFGGAIFTATQTMEHVKEGRKLGPTPAGMLPQEVWLNGTVAKLAMRQPFVLFKGLTFQKLCLP